MRLVASIVLMVMEGSMIGGMLGRASESMGRFIAVASKV
jgi:hypothetical protein